MKGKIETSKVSEETIKKTKKVLPLLPVMP